MIAQKTLRHWLYALGVFAYFLVPGTAAAATLNEVQWAIIEDRWSDAQSLAQTLDANDPAGDFAASYVEAARLTQQGRCDEATTIARALLGIRPTFAPAQELIFLCSTQTASRATAQAELAALLAILPEGPQRTILEQALATRDTRDGPRLSGYFEVKPSSNINRQTDATTIGNWTITPESRGQRGTEINAGLSVTQMLYGTPTFELSGTLKADLSWDTVSELLYPALTIETPMWFGSLDQIDLTATPFVTFTLEGSDHIRTAVGVRTALSTEISKDIFAGWSGAFYRTEHYNNPARNSWDIENTLTLSGLVNAQTRITGSLGLALHNADEAARNKRTLWGSLRLDHMMDAGPIIGLQGKVGRRTYESAPAPTQGPFQEDAFYSLRAELSHRDIVIGPLFGSNIRPVVFYEYTDQWSNNVFYDYQSHDVGVSMRVAF